MTAPDNHATVDAALVLGNGIESAERAAIVEQLASLDSRLRSFRAGSVELRLTIKERDMPSQRTTLEASIAGRPRIVATSTRTDFAPALSEVRDDLVRQITDAKTRTEPRNNRQRRDTSI